MATWTTPAKVITKEGLVTYEGVGLVTETAKAVAVASVTLNEVSNVESAFANGIISASASEIYNVPTYGEVTAPLPVVVSSLSSTWVGTILAPLPAVDSTLTISYDRTGVGAVITEIPVVTGSDASGRIITGAVEVPLATVAAFTGIVGAVQPTVVDVSGAGLTGLVGNGLANPVLPEVTGSLTQVAYTIGAVLTPKPIISGSLVAGNIIAGAVQARLAAVNGIGGTGRFSIGQVTPTIPVVTGSLWAENLMSGEVFPILPLVLGDLTIPVGAFTTWVMNTENARMTNYTQFPFLALGQLGDTFIGAASDGLYALEGDTDNGADISSGLTFGMADFKDELVSVVDAYVGGDLIGDMELGLLEDGQPTAYTYPLIQRDQHVRGHHAKLGRGLRSRYRQFSLTNVGGSDFTLDSFSLPPRDLKGNK